MMASFLPEDFTVKMDSVCYYKHHKQNLTETSEKATFCRYKPSTSNIYPSQKLLQPRINTFFGTFASCFAHSSTNRKLSLGKFFKDLLQHEGSGVSVAILHSYSRTASLVLNPIWRTCDKGVFIEIHSTMTRVQNINPFNYLYVVTVETPNLF